MDLWSPKDPESRGAPLKVKVTISSICLLREFKWRCVVYSDGLFSASCSWALDEAVLRVHVEFRRACVREVHRAVAGKR